MNMRKPAKAGPPSLVLGVAILAACATPTAAAASFLRSVAEAPSTVVAASPTRQLIGQVTGSTYFEVSPPAAGAYAFEYKLEGTAFFDTYVDEVELGYVGGSAGVHRTRPLSLTAGGHVVHVAGPEGAGTALVYLVERP
ncbi:hypothetical protein [Amycolatopsis sp. CA-126428]|uniref:hypothetical protein n=1 Tax=Amycolatopsis sp. CA-126428 TaxID=2073158 RepID=UPI0011B04CDD|nr:hypothetical protein [Amycolatopsis sp. CA-126428]